MEYVFYHRKNNRISIGSYGFGTSFVVTPLFLYCPQSSLYWNSQKQNINQKVECETV